MSTAGVAQKDLYYVAVKAFLERDGHLFIFKDRYGDWDLPGGRLRQDDFQTPLTDVLERKLSEELGKGFNYKIGEVAVLMRHERREAAPGNPKSRIFAIGYRVAFDGGELTLSEQHVESAWVRIDSFKPDNYFQGGWLEGVREYLALPRR